MSEHGAGGEETFNVPIRAYKWTSGALAVCSWFSSARTTPASRTRTAHQSGGGRSLVRHRSTPTSSTRITLLGRGSFSAAAT
jgi:hypothetical protein